MAYSTTGTLDAPAPPKQFTIKLTPPIPAGCAFAIYINGHLGIPGSRIGGLKVVGYGSSVDGCEVTLEATEKNPAATVTFAVICPAKAPNYVPHKLGGGYQPPKPKPFNPDVGRQVPERPDKDFVPQPGYRER